MAYLSFCAWLNPIKTFSLFTLKAGLLQLQGGESLQSQALVPGCLDLNSRCALCWACYLASLCLSLLNGEMGLLTVPIWQSGFLGGSVVKNLPANAGDTWDAGLFPESGISLEEETVTRSSILAWKIPWTEERGRLKSMGLQRVRHNWACSHLKMVGGISGIHFYQLQRTGKSFMLLVIIFHLLIFLFLPFLFLYLKLWASQISLVPLGADSWNSSVSLETTAMPMKTFLLGMKSERSNTQEMEQEQAAGGEQAFRGMCPRGWYLYGVTFWPSDSLGWKLHLNCVL